MTPINHPLWLPLRESPGSFPHLLLSTNKLQAHRSSPTCRVFGRCGLACNTTSPPTMATASRVGPQDFPLHGFKETTSQVVFRTSLKTEDPAVFFCFLFFFFFFLRRGRGVVFMFFCFPREGWWVERYLSASQAGTGRLQGSSSRGGFARSRGWQLTLTALDVPQSLFFCRGGGGACLALLV